MLFINVTHVSIKIHIKIEVMSTYYTDSMNENTDEEILVKNIKFVTNKWKQACYRPNDENVLHEL